MKIYVASSWRNEFQPDVVRILRDLAHDVYDFRNPPNRNGFAWEQVNPSWKSNPLADALDYRRALAHPTALAGYDEDIFALRECEALVYVLPCGRSASWEFGYAMGQGKKCYVLWLEKYEPELMFREAQILDSWANLAREFYRP